MVSDGALSAGHARALLGLNNKELISETGLSASELGTQLTLLEISGKIERRAGRAYALTRP